MLIALTVGIPLGPLLGLRAVTAQALAPVVQFLRMISPLFWAPIAMARFGIGNQPVIFLVAAGLGMADRAQYRGGGAGDRSRAAAGRAVLRRVTSGAAHW